MLSRIIGSKKVVLSLVPIVASLAATYTGHDPLEGLTAVVNLAFAQLVIIQGVLDFKWGSASDGTGR